MSIFNGQVWMLRLTVVKHLESMCFGGTMPHFLQPFDRFRVLSFAPRIMESVKFWVALPIEQLIDLKKGQRGFARQILELFLVP